MGTNKLTPRAAYDSVAQTIDAAVGAAAELVNDKQSDEMIAGALVVLEAILSADGPDAYVLIQNWADHYLPMLLEVHSAPPVDGWYVYNTERDTYFGPFRTPTQLHNYFTDSPSPAGPPESITQVEEIRYYYATAYHDHPGTPVMDLSSDA